MYNWTQNHTVLSQRVKKKNKLKAWQNPFPSGNNFFPVPSLLSLSHTHLLFSSNKVLDRNSYKCFQSWILKPTPAMLGCLSGYTACIGTMALVCSCSMQHGASYLDMARIHATETTGWGNEQSLGKCLKLSMSSSTALSQGLLAGMINVKNTESMTSPCGLMTSQTSGKVFAYLPVAFGLQGLVLF